MSSPDLIDRYEAVDALLKCVCSGILGPTKDVGVGYALMHTTDDKFVYSAALEPSDRPPVPLDRYQITIDRRTKKPSSSKKIETADEDMRKAIIAATGETVTSSARFIDGGLSISYRVTTQQNNDCSYIVQLRHHGNVASMDAIMKFVKANTPPGVIPLPAVYSIPGESKNQRATGFGRKSLPLYVACQQACWNLPLPLPCQIGELIAVDNGGNIDLSIGHDRHFSLGGPFTLVREWLRARIKHAVTSLERTNGIDDFKVEYLASIKALSDRCMDKIPHTVENNPVVALHVDMGLHNIIVSADNSTQINAIIDWEFCANAPFPAAHECIDRLFQAGAPNGFGPEYPHVDELRGAFWNEIPVWKAQWESQSAEDLMEWFRFARFMRPEYCSCQLPRAEKWKFWAENRRVVEGMLEKYGLEKK